MRDKTRQSGSTAVFVVCAVVLVLIALGVLCGVRRVAMNDQTPPMTVPESSESGDSQDSGDANNGGETVTRDPNDTSSSSDDSADNDTSSQAETPSTTETPSSSANSDTTTEAEKLPTTGPEDTVGAMVALALIATSGVAYVRSRAFI